MDEKKSEKSKGAETENTNSKIGHLHFDVSTGLKRVLGRELITDDEVAIFEMVKNSFDAGASEVVIYFDVDRFVIADNGAGMSYQDILTKWLFVAYSSKRSGAAINYRDAAAERTHFAGSKGIGRFSSDRIGNHLILQTRSQDEKAGDIHRMDVDWGLFEENDKQHFDDIPVAYKENKKFDVPQELRKFADSLGGGTVIEINQLRRVWSREELLNLKAALAKLINPFGAE